MGKHERSHQGSRETDSAFGLADAINFRTPDPVKRKRTGVTREFRLLRMEHLLARTSIQSSQQITRIVQTEG